MRIRLLGESLVAFRDSSGRVGLLDQHCPHRLASLFYGRNEDNGLRCLYHGWKFDVAGRCVDIPNQPDDCSLRNKIKARAYPCREANGITWTYMGSGPPPSLPSLGWAKVPVQQKSTLKYMRHCNWVQAMEGDFDSSRLGFLHRALDDDGHAQSFSKDPDGDGLRDIVALDKSPRLKVADTPLGVMYAARRDTPKDGQYWRITQFQLPFYTSIPAYGGMNRLKIWVPMDDKHTMVWEANWSQKSGVKRRTAARLERTRGCQRFSA